MECPPPQTSQGLPCSSALICSASFFIRAARQMSFSIFRSCVAQQWAKGPTPGVQKGVDLSALPTAQNSSVGRGGPGQSQNPVTSGGGGTREIPTVLLLQLNACSGGRELLPNNHQEIQLRPLGFAAAPVNHSGGNEERVGAAGGAREGGWGTHHAGLDHLGHVLGVLHFLLREDTSVRPRTAHRRFIQWITTNENVSHARCLSPLL